MKKQRTVRRPVPFWLEPLMRYAPYADEGLNRAYRRANRGDKQHQQPAILYEVGPDLRDPFAHE